MSEDSFGDVVEDASALHNHDTAGDLVSFVCRRELLDSERPQSVYAHCTHSYVSPTANVARSVKSEALGSWPCTIAASAHGAQSSR